VHAQVTQQTADSCNRFTRLENMSAVIHTHAAVMCSCTSGSAPAACSQTCTGTCAFCITLCTQSDNRQQTAVIDYTRLETCQQSFIHMLMCSKLRSAQQPVSVHVCGTLSFCNNPVHTQVTQQTDSCHRLCRLENMPAVIHTCCMCLVPQACLQPVSVHVLALCAFAITPYALTQ
jgi:hypothetical protein